MLEKADRNFVQASKKLARILKIFYINYIFQINPNKTQNKAIYYTF